MNNDNFDGTDIATALLVVLGFIACCVWIAITQEPKEEP